MQPRNAQPEPPLHKHARQRVLKTFLRHPRWRCGRVGSVPRAQQHERADAPVAPLEAQPHSAQPGLPLRQRGRRRTQLAYLHRLRRQCERVTAAPRAKQQVRVPPASRPSVTQPSSTFSSVMLCQRARQRTQCHVGVARAGVRAVPSSAARAAANSTRRQGGRQALPRDATNAAPLAIAPARAARCLRPARRPACSVGSARRRCDRST